jgi:flagellar protein FlaG
MQVQIETIEQNKRELAGPEAVTPPRQAEFPGELPHKKKHLESSSSPQKTSSESKNVHEVEVEKVSNALEQFWDAMGVSLKFKVHKDTDTIQVEVIDPSSEKVIKKIPEDEILNMAASLKESVGFLVDKNF